ncbi:erythromycin esterase family protein [Actinokineospora pegani]|uniref:erythromycin esterase family protein n=1 Tax=Actinokineospora pegani TaxID=2654637 RepID=UPI0012EA8557|nr:erythromycin esterase family protein [Actinokineospora pegani]
MDIDPKTLATAAELDTAAVVGLGTSTREASELVQLVAATTRLLVDRGFRLIAIQDSQRVGDLLDRYLLGGPIDLGVVLSQAWGPWRTAETREALVGLRARNEAHPDDPVRVMGLGPARVLPADYDRVVELTGPHVIAALAPLRESHQHGEHVMRARGVHPGRPFVEVAAEVRATVTDPEASRLMDAIVEHHANAIGAGHDAAREERAADRLLARAAERVVIWDGTLHVAAHRTGMVGQHLSAALGTAYRAVHLTFATGRIRDFDVPVPAPDSLEATLPTGVTKTTGLGESRTRLISGVYDPSRDEDHYYSLPSLSEAFAAVALLPEISPTTSL